MKNFFTLVAFTLISASAFAQSNGLYGEVAYGATNIKDTSSYNLGTWKPAVARFTLGKVIADNVAVEGLLTQGISKSSVTYSGINIQLALNTSYGIALRPFYKLNDDFEVFGRVGKFVNKYTSTISTTIESGTSYNNLYSVGTAYKINNSFNVILDYTKFNNKGDVDVSMTAVGLRYNF